MERFPPAIISGHAAIRLTERFRIPLEKVLTDLNSGLGKKIGVSRETHIIYRLMWSIDDDCHFIALQDVVKGTVVTFYTVKMYEDRYKEVIAQKRLAAVKNQLVTRGVLPSKDRIYHDLPSGKIVVVGYFSDNCAFPSKPKALGCWRSESDISSIEDIGAEEAFWVWVSDRIKEKGFCINELQTVMGRHSNRDDRSVIRCML